MTDNDYHPVSCELHSELELAIMHRTNLILSWQNNNQLQTLVITPSDIKTKDKQEFLYALTEKDETLEIRLDKISSMIPA